MSRLASLVLMAVLAVGLSADVAAAQGAADLQITKIADQKTVKIGETITYTITLTNLGPDVATDVAFGDPIPDQLNLVSSTCGDVSAFCTVTSLPAGASATLTVVATPITNPAQSERRVTNCAFIAEAGSTDPNPANDIACVKIKIVGRL
jgi:large repetitive protein